MARELYHSRLVHHRDQTPFFPDSAGRFAGLDSGGRWSCCERACGMPSRWAADLAAALTIRLLPGCRKIRLERGNMVI